MLEFQNSLLTLGAAGEFLTQNLTYIFAGAIVLVGLVLYGFRDLIRLSAGRIWALSGVAFDESIRRRVLWLIPLAFLGVIVVVQFQIAIDPQDAIRQTTKVCLFATGVVVIVTSLILACSSLPKEIESRVIYTVVTKPTTRLEIVFGKIVGFARVSGTILIIMGIFTFGYLKLRESRLLADTRARLRAEAVDPVSKEVFEHYTEAGLLATKSMEHADEVQVMARPPQGPGERRMAGGQSQYYVVAFDLSTQERDLIAQTVSKGGGLFIVNTLAYEQREPTPEEERQIADLRLPLKEGELPAAQLQLQILDRNRVRLVAPEQLNDGEPVSLPPAEVGPRPAPAFLEAEGIQALVDAGQFFISVLGVTPAVEYIVGPMPTVLVLLGPKGEQVAVFEPVARNSFVRNEDDPWTQPVNGDLVAPVLLSMQGRYGMQLMGREDGEGSVAVYRFSGVDVPDPSNGPATLEVRIGTEGSSMDFTAEGENVAKMSLQVRNRKTGDTSAPQEFIPENNRVSYVPVPAGLLRGGDFEVIVRALTPDQWFGLQSDSVAVITADRSFLLNLFKSLLTLWLMSILVIAISVFCSTWLSWPIAVVLTLVILLGRWGVEQVGGAAGVGLGTEVTRSMGIEDPTATTVVRTSVNFLSATVDVLAAFLPDISRFSVTEDIERGISIPPAKIAEGAWVLLTYGLPISVLAYVLLRWKEVAP